MTSIDPRLADFLVRRIGYKPEEILRMSKQTRLQHDLHLLGDNLSDMLDLFAKEFNIDFSSYEWQKYDPGEKYFLSWRNIFRSQKKLFEDALRWVQPITLGMLEDAIERGRW